LTKLGGNFLRHSVVLSNGSVYLPIANSDCQQKLIQRVMDYCFADC